MVIQTTTGTLKARAIARCSFDIPISPALAPTIRITHDGAPDVNPYRVVFKYRSWPARSTKWRYIYETESRQTDLPLNETILADCAEISSQPSLSRRITFASADGSIFGSTGVPAVEKPRIWVKRCRIV